MIADPTFWYLISFVVFVGALYRPLKGVILSGLENKSAQIRKDLEEAKALRDEAEDLFNQAQNRREESIIEAKNILEHAQKEANRLREQTVEDINQLVEQQKVQLTDRINRMENSAVTEIQEHMVKVAVDTAKEVIVSTLDDKTNNKIAEHSLKKIKHLA